MKKMTMDGNGAASYVSYAFSEIAVIYPITPSSHMAEQADEWAASKRPTFSGKFPKSCKCNRKVGRQARYTVVLPAALWRRRTRVAKACF